jgi:hypothetical protein
MKAVDIFLDAINEGTLAKGTCTTCAVGNLVAHGLGGKITINGLRASCATPTGSRIYNGHWANAFVTADGEQDVYADQFDDSDVIQSIKATDFTLKELMQIEFAFETNTEIYLYSYDIHTPQEIRADQIKGLEAVVKVMLAFEDDTLATDEMVKEIFTDKANLIHKHDEPNEMAKETK